MLGGLAMLQTVNAQQTGLRIAIDAGQRSAEQAVGEQHFEVINESGAELRQLRLHSSIADQVVCAARTQSNRAFEMGGVLAAGDRLSCVRTIRDVQRRSSAVIVSALNASNKAIIEHSSLQALGAPVTPDQGIAVLLGGAVHNDTDSDGRLDAGELLEYHYTVVNLGSLALSELALTDIDGAVTCPQTTLAVGAHFICTRNYVITAQDQADGLVLNELELLGMDASQRPIQAGDLVLSLNLAGRSGIRVFKSPLLVDDIDNGGFASVGDLLRYTFVVKNSNSDPLSMVELVEPDPTRIDTPIVCSPLTLGNVPFGSNGTGMLQSLDTELCTAEYTVRQSDSVLGQVLNLVRVTARSPFNSLISATGASAVVVPGSTQISVAKVANVGQAFGGDTVIYTVTVTNTGNLAIANVTVIDPLPDGIVSFDWTCAGASCPNLAGTGAINETIPLFPVGAQVVYTIQAVIADNPPTPILNMVSVTPGGPVTCSPSNLPPPCQSDVPINTRPTPIGVPVNAPWASAALILLFALLAAGAFRRVARADGLGVD